MFFAEKGGGAYLNDRRLRVSARGQLGEALIGTGIPFREHGDHARYLATLAPVMNATTGVRRLGVASLDLAYVAAGRFDGYWEFGLKPWDLAAGSDPGAGSGRHDRRSRRRQPAGDRRHRRR